MDIQLKPDSEFRKVFTDGKVSLLSTEPIVPREANSPHCYPVDCRFLSEYQKEALNRLFYERWAEDCKSIVLIDGDVEPTEDLMLNKGLLSKNFHFFLGINDEGDIYTLFTEQAFNNFCQLLFNGKDPRDREEQHGTEHT
ncbi:MAG: hypothetical protein F6K31_15050 [Symploca sp. SIO2G7]|nr:hypothetical protein [Symploca sp. SIO2G7]